MGRQDFRPSRESATSGRVNQGFGTPHPPALGGPLELGLFRLELSLFRLELVPRTASCQKPGLVVAPNPRPQNERIGAVTSPAHEVALGLMSSMNPTAGMDLSDGLLGTVFTLAELNGLGVTLCEESLPISAPAIEMGHRFSVDPLRLAFGTGDWQIAYSVDPVEWQRQDRTSGTASRVSHIGTFTDDKAGIWLLCRDGHRRQLRRIEQQSFLETWADRGFLEYLLDTPLFVL